MGDITYYLLPITYYLITDYNFSVRKRKKERTVDALALGGDEGRGKLR